MPDKQLIFCDTQIPDSTECCLTCKNMMVNEPWGDLKCKFKNHIVNKAANGYVCKDYKSTVKKTITENLEGGVVDDRA